MNTDQFLGSIIAIALVIFIPYFIFVSIMLPFNVKGIKKAVEKIVDLLEKEKK